MFDLAVTGNWYQSSEPTKVDGSDHSIEYIMMVY